VSASRNSMPTLRNRGSRDADGSGDYGCYFKSKGGEIEMSEPKEVLFEISIVDGKVMVEALGIPLDAEASQLQVLINNVDVNRTMKISSLKIVKVF
jgi:hypothetical protein